MPYAQAPGARLYFEEAGRGLPIIFVHEFAADYRTWENQMRFFSRRYRCIAFNARGYPPSDVPAEDAQYGQAQAADDIVAVLDHLGLSQAHVVGLSMGGGAALHLGLRHPARALSIVATSAGSGSVKADQTRFRAAALASAEAVRAHGMRALVSEYAENATRQPLAAKDPRGHAEFTRYLLEHSALGSALTLANYQAKRDSLFDLGTHFAAMAVPTFLVVGDSDEPVLDVNLWLKRTLPDAQLWVVPGTGHSVNLEEPGWYNAQLSEFLDRIERR
jgi:pimeloyl-ACP methyl ester carboxylesterase